MTHQLCNQCGSTFFIELHAVTKMVDGSLCRSPMKGSAIFKCSNCGGILDQNDQFTEMQKEARRGAAQEARRKADVEGGAD
jgi:Fe2+ or Zn2+ uptake regulation protein